MKKIINEKNIERFNGFSETYDGNRPVPPEIITKAVMLYLKNKPDIVIDIASGTGLSTFIWSDLARTVIGIEPNADMRSEAEKKVSSERNVSFREGVANDTGLQDECADIVTVSQAFHWFDIDSALEEIYRILKTSGVLAVYDCDWPPSVDRRIEEAYRKLLNKANAISSSVESPAVKNDKASYLNRINSFGKFRFSKEILLHSVEKCTPERIIGLALSQGGIQSALKIDPSIQSDIDGFSDLAVSRLQCETDIIFSYRLRLAIK